MIRPGENVYYYHNDHLGTPQILTDASGAIAWKASYTPFGEAEILIETVENPFRFPGQYYDVETGLHYNYSRNYHPGIGRYVQPDPIGLLGGINPYVYVGNNPLTRIDPLGLMWSGPGVNVVIGLMSGGVTGGVYRVQNWSTGEHCIILVYGSGLGGALGGSINAESTWIWNAPTSDDLGGAVNGIVVFGGVGISGVGGSYGKGGCSESIKPNEDLVDPSNSYSLNFGAGLGYGGGYFIGDFRTKVLHCW